jgi:hypothetical protein
MRGRTIVGVLDVSAGPSAALLTESACREIRDAPAEAAPRAFYAASPL